MNVDDTRGAVADVLSFVQSRHSDPIQALLVLTFAYAIMVGVVADWPTRALRRYGIAIRAAWNAGRQVIRLLKRHDEFTT